MAKSPDALVALYSKAQMHGENYLSRTNLQGFKTELKNLASMMGDLDFDQGSKSNTSSTKGTNLNPSSTSTSMNLQNPAFNNSHLTPASAQGNQSTFLGSSTAAAQNSIAQQSIAQQSIAQHSAAQQPLNQQPPFGAMVSTNGSGLSSYLGDNSFPTNSGLGVPTVNADLRGLLDSRSLNMIQEVKNHFNLSSESEAIRLLLAMGYQKVRTQF